MLNSIIACLVVYMLFSVLVAFCTIRNMIEIEDYYNSVPIGDLELYGKPKYFSFINFIFFPCFLMIGIYLLLVRLVNFIFFR